MTVGHEPPRQAHRQQVFHIVEEPGGIRHLTECEVPTEEFNAARTADIAARYPNLSPGVLEHLDALEPFLNTSIVAGFSYGVNKADLVVMKGELLGHVVSRQGSFHSPEPKRSGNSLH